MSTVKGIPLASESDQHSHFDEIAALYPDPTTVRVGTVVEMADGCRWTRGEERSADPCPTCGHRAWGPVIEWAAGPL